MEAFLTTFALEEAQVLAVLEEAVGSSLVGFTLSTPDSESSHESSTQRVDFCCLLPSGEVVEKAIFVKKCVWKNKSEAIHYRYLASKGVPTPRLYGAIQSAAEAEVIFVEPVTATGFQEDSEVEWRKMLSLLACFNACQVTAEYELHLHPYEQVGQVDANFWVTGLEAHPEENQIEAGLRASGVDDDDLPKLMQTARQVFAEVAAQPRGLLHQDFLPDNFGWRGMREEMVVFDLHKNSVGPRFADVAVYLGLPDWSGRRLFLDSPAAEIGTRREALITHYLAECARFGGVQVSPETFRAETNALFWTHKISALSWLAERNQEEAVQEVLAFLRHPPNSV